MRDLHNPNQTQTFMNVPQNNKHDGNQMPKNVGLTKYLQRGSNEGSWYDNEHVIVSTHTS